jgi:hypothetical protein
MVRLADEYPGSLREIDSLPLDRIVERVEALVLAERRPSHVEPWMTAQAAFHRYARGALAAKRWLAGRKTITPQLRASFLRSVRTLARGAEAELFADELDLIARPPGGRLMDVVHARVARALDITTAEARELVFGASRNARRRVR